SHGGKRIMVQARRRTAAKPASQALRLTHIPARVWKVGMLLALTVALLGAGLVFKSMLNNPENFTISRVDVQGERKFIKDQELKTIIEKYTKTNLYLLDTAGLETDLKALPWVRRVILRKIWPSSLGIEIEEQQPVAFWGRERLMNPWGEIFAAELPAMRGVLPVLYSPEDKGREMGERYVQIKAWLKGLPLEIAELTEDESGTWRMKIKGGPEVIIGNEDQERRIARFKVGFQRELVNKLASVRRIDLRYTNGFAVEWKQSRSDARGTTDGMAGVSNVEERS
ncbi:MAG: cell division protein FtsQ/DivIB, partial [Thiothrix sp.]